MPDQKPMNVYPDPDGTSNSNAYVPSNTATATGAAVSGGVSVVTASTAIISGLITNTVAFIQSSPGYQAPDLTTFLGFHDLGPKRVAIVVFFGALSVLLQVINLVRGIQMKERLRKLSEQVCDLCEKAGLLPKNKAA